MERQGTPEHPFQYNAGNEKQPDAVGYGYSYATDWRGYDPQLGRFHGIDALAHEMPGINPYQYGYNNPVMFNDPTGLFVFPVVEVIGKRFLGQALAQVGTRLGMQFLGAAAVQAVGGSLGLAAGGGSGGCCGGGQAQGSQSANSGQQTDPQQSFVNNPFSGPVVGRAMAQAAQKGASWVVRGVTAGASFLSGMLLSHPAGSGSALNNQLSQEAEQRFNELEARRTSKNAGSQPLTTEELEELNQLVRQKFPARRVPYYTAEEGFKSLAELGLRDGMRVSPSKALELGEKFLGKGYQEPIPGSGRYVSADGKRVFRMGISDITGAHGYGPHVNFETLIPNPAKPGKMMVDQNFHIYLIH